MNDLTVKGITAYKAGNRIEARQLLRLATVQDPNDIIAWIWLSAAVETNQDRRECLESVLKIDPTNVLALRGLEKLKNAPNLPAIEPVDPEPKSNLPPGSVFISEDSQEPIPPEPPIGIMGDPKSKKPVKHKAVWIVVGSLGLVFFCAIGAYIAIQKYLDGLLSQAALSDATIVAVFSTQPPILDETPSPISQQTPSPVLVATDTLTPTPSPTKTPTSTPSFQPAGATVDAEMFIIQKQVASLRGLPAPTTIGSFLIPKDRAEQMLRTDLVNDELILELERQQQVWSTLGLVPPSYDLVNSALNHMIDGIGGFYQPWKKQIFVLGIWFRGMEHFIYAHEFDHAIVDNHFAMDQLGLSPSCTLSEQSCDALRAVVEGDANLAMYQWLEQHADKQDYTELVNYRPPLMLLTEEAPPPFIEQDAGFAYNYGFEFVKTLYQRGGWEEVNRAYENPPTTTEQIMHPDIYLSGEKPVAVDDPALDDVLGPDWARIQNDALGEWSTYLILAYSADPGARVDPAMAEKAAAGWGGDHYQVYRNATTQTTILAVHSVWDSLADSAEFDQAAQQYLNGRFQGLEVTNELGRHCWQANGQTSCLFLKEEQALWIIAPDQATVDKIRGAYPLFQ